MTEQEACERIIAWAKEYFTPISTAPEEYEFNIKVEVVDIHYEPEFDVWDAKLRVSSLLTEPYVTFTEDSMYPHDVQVSNVEV